MFTKKSFEEELTESMSKNLVVSAVETTHKLEKLARAADYLYSAADIFDDCGFTVEGDAITSVLESLAAKKKKPVKGKKSDKKSKESEKFLANLKDHGTMLDKNDAEDMDGLEDSHNDQVWKLMQAGLSPREIKEVFDRRKKSVTPSMDMSDLNSLEDSFEDEGEETDEEKYGDHFPSREMEEASSPFLSGLDDMMDEYPDHFDHDMISRKNHDSF